jgi:hypothetical protein
MKYSVLTLLALAVLLPLYSFSSLSDGRGDSVYVWNVVRSEPVMGLAFVAPLLVLVMLGRRIRHPWNRVVLATAPLIIIVAVFVVYLDSALAISAEANPIPLLPLPPLWVSSSIGLGCWAYVAANALLLGCWAQAARNRNAGIQVEAT